MPWLNLNYFSKSGNRNILVTTPEGLQHVARAQNITSLQRKSIRIISNCMEAVVVLLEPSFDFLSHRIYLTLSIYDCTSLVFFFFFFFTIFYDISTSQSQLPYYKHDVLSRSRMKCSLNVVNQYGVYICHVIERESLTTSHMGWKQSVMWKKKWEVEWKLCFMTSGEWDQMCFVRTVSYVKRNSVTIK